MDVIYVVLFATCAIVFIATPLHGCHVTPNNRRSLYHHKTSIAEFFATCLTKKTGKPYRWEAIAKFAIEDTTWYDISGSKYCGSGRDTDECWENQTDFLIAKSSPYSYFVKMCIQEYTDKESSFLPKLEYDSTALQAKRSGRAKRAIDSSNMLLLWLTQQWARSGHLAPNTTRYPASSTTRRTLFNPLRPTTKVQPRPSTTQVANPVRIFPWNAPYPLPNPFQYPVPATAPTQAPTNTPYLFTQPPHPHGPHNNQVGGNQQQTVYPVPPNNFQSLPSWMQPPPSPQNVPGVPPTPNSFSFTSTHHPHGGWIHPQHSPSTTTPPPYSNTPTGNPHNFGQQFPGHQPQPSNHFPHHPYPSTHPPLPHYPGHVTQAPTTTSTPLDLSNVDLSELSQNDIMLLQLLQGNSVIPTTTTTTTTTTPPLINQGGMSDSQFQQLLNYLKLKIDGQDLYEEGDGEIQSTTKPPFTGSMCDDESQAKYLSCVKTKMSTSPESTGRMLSPFEKVLTLQDVVSIVVFFLENRSQCTPVDKWEPKQGGIVRQCSQESSSRTGPLTCLPDFMIRIVKSGSSLQSMFRNCA